MDQTENETSIFVEDRSWQVRWSSALAGSVVLVSVALFLWSIALAVVSVVAGAAPAKGIALALWICAMATTIIGAAVGGWVAGRSAGDDRASVRAAHGFIAWGLSLILASAFQVLAARDVVAATANMLANDDNLNQDNAAEVPGNVPQDPTRTNRMARDYWVGASWSWAGTWFLAGLVAIGAGAAAGGGSRTFIAEAPPIDDDAARRRRGSFSRPLPT
ncbi:MAG: hypothetical protein ABSC94_31895 [Polyangiaceae bacterium]|jgi:hypothetical protein